MNNCFEISNVRCALQYIFILLYLSILNTAKAQCPVVDFTLSDTVCVNEYLNIENSSTTGESYEWDFCAGGLHVVNSNFSKVTDVSASSLTFGLDLAYDTATSSWIGLVTQRQNHAIQLLNFGSSLNNSPTKSIILKGLPLRNPDKIMILNEDGKWYALVTNDLPPYDLIKINFGESLSTVENIQNLGNPQNVLERPKAIDYLRDIENNLFVILANFSNSKIVSLNFRNSINNILTKENVNTFETNLSSNQIFDIDIIRSCNSWYAFTPLSGEGKLVQISLGDNIDANEFSVQEILDIGSSVFTFQIMHDGLSYVGLLMHRDGTLTRFDLGNSIGDKYDIIDSYNSINIDGGKKIKIIRDEFRNWSVYALEATTSDLYVGDFVSNCSNTNYLSNLREPQFNYTSSGNYLVSHKIVDQKGAISYSYDSIFVREQISPSVDYKILNEDRCVSTPVQFSAFSDNEAEVVKYTWEFGDGSVLEGKDVSHQFTKSGIYKVNVTIESQDNCSNFVEKEVVIFDELGFTTTSIICTNSEVKFFNSNTLPQPDTIDWLWDFNGEGSSTEANPRFTFTTSGSKTVSLTASIPGCFNTYDTTFTVQQGPIVDFSIPPQICQGEEISFENLVSGENITGYQWIFGDGGTYSSTALESPSYEYDSAGTYIAMLEVNNTLGCANTLSKTITIYARPQAAFTADIACAGAPTQFADESTTGINSNVIAWNWSFGDGRVSQARNPQYTYDLPGVYEASLVVLTSAGCTDTLVQEIVVESAVQADFSAQTLCPAEGQIYTVQFSDLSSAAEGEDISEWLWTINEENFVIANPTYVFDAPGTYQVSLTVFSETACNASVTKNITIATPPTPAFSFVPNCAGAPVNFTNESLADEVEISQYTWDFGGLGISYDKNPSFIFEKAGNYAVSLTLETDQGCQYNITQEVVIPAAPRAEFTADVNYGGAPLTVNFTNSSTAASSFLWDFGGLGESSEENPTYIFTVPGNYKVSLQAESELGCTDYYTQDIRVVAPVTDLQLQNVSILSEENDPDVSMLLTIRNLGTLAMSDFEITITIDQLLTIRETFEGTLPPGQTVNYPIDFRVATQGNQNIDLRYICATLEALPKELDINNNRACASLEERFSVVTPYPNPSGDEIKVDMVLPRQEMVRLSLITLRGEILQNQTFEDTRVGLNTFKLDLSAMVTGSYILQVNYAGHTETHRLMVKP